MATLTFVDAVGAPWPVTELVGPQAAGLDHRVASGHAHVVILESRREAGSTNLVALLDGLASPLHMEVAPGGADAATRVEVRLEAERPKAGAWSNAPRPGMADADAFEAAVRDYLLAHPEVLREALDPSRQLASNVAAQRAELLAAPGVPALGDESGSVTVVEFFDYRCGFCKRSLDAVRSALGREGVRVEMREYPILGEDSERAARAALAAARQGAYEAAHFALMAHEGAFDAATIEALAADLGLDVDRLRADMESAEVGALIEANRDLAGRLGVTGTPAFLVLGAERVRVSPGAVDADRLNGLIDDAG